MVEPVSITGNLNTLLGANAASGFVQFVLLNSGRSIPYVAGVTNMVDLRVTMEADDSGNISGELWGNDVITPAGTQYRVIIGSQSNIYNIVGSAWNLNTATPADRPPSGTVTIPNAEQPLAVTITGVPVDGGDFTLPHTLGYVPRNAIIQVSALCLVVFQPSYYDSDNLYLEASAGEATGRVLVW